MMNIFRKIMFLIALLAMLGSALVYCWLKIKAGLPASGGIALKNGFSLAVSLALLSAAITYLKGFGKDELQEKLIKASFIGTLVVAALIDGLIISGFNPGVLKLFSFVLIGVFTVIGLMEIWKIPRIGLAEKLMWTTGFIFGIGMFARPLYFFFGRTRAIRRFKLLAI